MAALMPKLQKKLDATEKLYHELQEFAETLPMFADEIINGELTPDKYCRLGYKYKDMYLDWGINWTPCQPTNYDLQYHNEKTVSVYLNCSSLFNDHVYDFARIELDKCINGISFFHYDHLNSTVYFEPHQVEEGLEAIYQWYLFVKQQAGNIFNQKRIEELERELNLLKGTQS